MKLPKAAEHKILQAIAIADEQTVIAVLVEHAEIFAKLIGMPLAELVAIIQSPTGRRSIMKWLLRARSYGSA
jgi:hypothetical protein